MKPNDEEEILPLYQKVGKRYKVIGVNVNTNLIEVGHWHINVETDGHSVRCIRRKISPDYLSFEAAMKEFADSIIDKMFIASKMRIGKRVPQVVADAFQRLKEELGDDLPVYFEYASVLEIVEEGLRELRDKCE